MLTRLRDARVTGLQLTPIGTAAVLTHIVNSYCAACMVLASGVRLAEDRNPKSCEEKQRKGKYNFRERGERQRMLQRKVGRERQDKEFAVKGFLAVKIYSLPVHL